VLAQAWVNRYRKTHREVSLESEAEAGVQFAADASAPVAAPSSLLMKATDAALATLTSEERFILSSYYLDQRTLAEVARTLGVHESTVSRKLERIAAATRKNVLGYLTKAGSSRRQAEDAMETDVRDLPLDVRQALESKAPQQDLPAPVSEKKSNAKAAQDSGDTTF
jgi:RNA polymerase sigma-70 factor, ECF subfamily